MSIDAVTTSGAADLAVYGGPAAPGRMTGSGAGLLVPATAQTRSEDPAGGQVSETPGIADLILAIRQKDLAEVTSVLARDADPNAVPDGGGLSPLFEAVLVDDAAILGALLDAGADIRGRVMEDRDSFHSALSFAALHGKRDVADALIDRGADISSVACTPTYCGNVITMAASVGEAEFVLALAEHVTTSQVDELLNFSGFYLRIRLLLRQNWLDDDARRIVRRGYRHHVPPLIAAARFGHADVFGHLLDLGADIELTIGGSTPLSSARRNGHEAIIALISAEKEKSDQFIAVVRSGNRDEVVELIVSGIDINRSGSRKFTPLFHAVEVGDADMVRLLFEYGADPDAGAYQYRGTYNVGPLHLAIMNGRADLTTILVDAGANVNASRSDEMGNPYTTLNDAIIAGNNDVVFELLRRGADPLGFAGPAYNVCRPSSYLELAAAVGNVDLVRQFAAEGVVIDPEEIQGGDGNDFGLSPLMVAACSGHANIVSVLLDEYGVNVSTKNRGGCTALDYAIIHDRGETADILRSTGAMADREGCRHYGIMGNH